MVAFFQVHSNVYNGVFISQMECAYNIIILKRPELDSHTLHSYPHVNSDAKAPLAVNNIHSVMAWAYCSALALSLYANQIKSNQIKSGLCWHEISQKD